MTVAELLGRLSSLELAEWQAYFSLGADEELERGLAAKATSGLRQRLAARRAGRG